MSVLAHLDVDDVAGLDEEASVAALHQALQSHALLLSLGLIEPL